MLADYFLNVPVFITWGAELRRWAILFMAITIAGAVIGLTITCVKDIVAKKPKIWYYRLWMLFVLYGWLITGLVLGSSHQYYTFLFNNVVAVIYMTMMGLTAFSLFAALYRSLRIRNFDVFLLAGITAIVTIGNVPIGDVIWPGFPLMREWLFEAPVLGGDRALLIITAIGGASICYNIIIGKNRLWMGQTREDEAQ